MLCNFYPIPNSNSTLTVSVTEIIQIIWVIAYTFEEINKVKKNKNSISKQCLIYSILKVFSKHECDSKRANFKIF